MDDVGVYLHNTKNKLVHETSQGDIHHPVIRKWSHPWFHLGKAANAAFLTETELRGLHRRFGHPTVDRLSRSLEKAGHEDVEHEVLRTVTNSVTIVN